MSLSHAAQPHAAAGRRPAIEFVGVNKWYGAHHALRDIYLTVDLGERVVVCGPSGSGKSTLIRCVNRLEEHQRGAIWVNGVELTHSLRQTDRVRQDVGMVFQQFNLFPHLTVLQNCTLAPIWGRSVGRAEAEETARALLDKVRIGDQAHKFPSQLSGGQQ
jgi:general L-amino acid transport system ATP-binding protein